jgi:Cu/Ag efflux protein CusF
MKGAKPTPNIAAIIIVALLFGCSSSPSKPKLYKMSGTIVSGEIDYHQVTVNRRDIPGFMGAMTMPYIVKDEAELRKLHSGDEIEADLLVNKETGEAWLANIKIIKKSANTGLGRAAAN